MLGIIYKMIKKKQLHLFLKDMSSLKIVQLLNIQTRLVLLVTQTKKYTNLFLTDLSSLKNAHCQQLEAKRRHQR